MLRHSRMEWECEEARMEVRCVDTIRCVLSCRSVFLLCVCMFMLRYDIIYDSLAAVTPVEGHSRISSSLVVSSIRRTYSYCTSSSEHYWRWPHSDDGLV